MIYLKFLRSLLRHKWFVFLAGRRVGVPLWRLIIHDWSKLTPSEFCAYAHKFEGDGDNQDEFVKAWLHHENRNDHHWGYWIPRSGFDKAIPMPEVCVKEMVADWHGAGRAYTGSWNIAEWVSDNTSKMRFHRITVERIHETMLNLGYVLTDNCNWSFAWVKDDDII